ncbi:MAG: hypothetical protein AAB709_01000 [Patescibacteria group bacterium]
MDDEEFNDGILPDDKVDEEDEGTLSEMGFHKVEGLGGFEEPEKDF